MISGLDMFYDFLVLIQFAKNDDIFWFALSLGCALSPYVIAYSSLNSYFVYRGVFKGSKTRNFLGFLFMFPVSMVYFFIFDVFFMAQTIINDTFNLLFSRSVIDTDGLIDSIFTKMGLTLMVSSWINHRKQKSFYKIEDSKGYRRLRTLSQLTFESIPQIVTRTISLSFWNIFLNHTCAKNVSISRIHKDLIAVF